MGESVRAKSRVCNALCFICCNLYRVRYCGIDWVHERKMLGLPDLVAGEGVSRGLD